MKGDGIDWQGVLAHASERLDRDPGDRDARRTCAQAFGALGNVERALAMIEEHLRDHPDDARAWDLRCAYLMGFGRYEDAVVSGDRAVAADPGNVILRYDRACAHALAGNTGEALADLEEAISCDADLRGFAREDDSFAGLKGDERFRALVGE